MTVEFDVDAVPPSSKGVYRISIPADNDPDELLESIFLASSDTASEDSIREELLSFLHDGELSVPVLAARGAEPGETLVVTAGVHGDEYEGILAIHRVFDDLDPARMREEGVVIVTRATPRVFAGELVAALASESSRGCT